MTRARRKTVLITAIIAVAVIAAATLCFFFAIMFTFNNEAALCNYLDKNGVTEEDLSLIISGLKSVEKTFDGDEKSYYEGVNALYALAVKAADNRTLIEEALNAYYDAPVLCNPFSMMKYSSVLQQLRPLKDKPMTSVSLNDIGKDKIIDSAKQLLSVCEGMTKIGKYEFDESVKTLRAAAEAENILEEVSFKSLINLALYAVKVSKEADFSKTYIITDSFLGNGFCDRYSDGIKSATIVLRSLDYNTLLALSGYLPDTSVFAAALCNYAESVQGFDSVAFCNAFTAALNALYTKNGKNLSLDTADVETNFKTLAEVDPDNISEQEKVKIKHAADYFLNALTL